MAQMVLLCIDDDRVGLYVRRLVLESAGYQVLTASSGLEGIEMFERHAVDAVLLDFHMPPGIDGGEVARRMRRIKPDIPILLLSAYVSLPEEALAAVDAYVVKGESPQVWLDELASLLRPQPQSLRDIPRLRSLSG